MNVRRWMGIFACATAAGCAAMYPDVDSQDAEAKDTATAADVKSDTGAGADVAVTDVAVADTVADVATPADATAVDAQGDATPVADAQPDVEDVAVDVAIDAAPDVAVDVGADTADAIAGLPVSPTNIDVVGIVWTCNDPNWQLGACAAGVETSPPLLPGIHVDLPNPITYADLPPTSGTHRPVWGKWGSYVFLPQQRWLHNIEHGAVAFLYNPCVPSDIISSLHALAKAVPDDATGPFRWVLTPYPNLPTAIAVVTWGHLYTAECVDQVAIDAFIAAHYRKAPEDEPYPGGYEELWLGDWP